MSSQQYPTRLDAPAAARCWPRLATASAADWGVRMDEQGDYRAVATPLSRARRRSPASSPASSASSRSPRSCLALLSPALSSANDTFHSRSHSHALSAILGGLSGPAPPASPPAASALGHWRRASGSLAVQQLAVADKDKGVRRAERPRGGSQSSAGDWDPRPRAGPACFSARRRRRLARKLAWWGAALALYLALFALSLALPAPLQALAPVVVGSALSVAAALFVCGSHALGRAEDTPAEAAAASAAASRRAEDAADCRYPNQLLVHVAACELGLGLVALAHVLRYCEADGAAISCRPMSFRACNVSVVLEMLLLLASVGWFGAAIVHLFVSVSNPFASFRAQLRVYHAAVWGGSALVSVLVPVVLYSERSQRAYGMTRPELCRAVALSLPMLPRAAAGDDREQVVGDWQRLNMAYWGALFLVVVLLVVAAQFILVVGWWRSNSGTVIALKARRRMMRRMTVYVHTLNATWLALLIAFFAFRSSAGALAHVPAIGDDGASAYRGMDALGAAFYYSLAAKGFFTCVVWVAVNKSERSRAGGCRLGACRRDRQAADGCRTGGALDADADSRVATVFSGAATDVRSSTVAAPEAMSASFGRSTRMVREEMSASSSSPSSSCSSASSVSSVASFPARSGLSSRASQNNETLQREIIYYTVCGITKSILRSVERAREAEAASAAAPPMQQQLLVGAGRDPVFANNPTLEHVQALRVLQSPRAFCLRGDEPPGPRAQPASASESGGDADADADADADSRPSRGFSMYPVSHVPFELFEAEIELQSHGTTAPIELDGAGGSAGEPAPVSGSPPPPPPPPPPPLSTSTSLSSADAPAADPLALSSRRRSALFASRRLSMPTNREARSASLSKSLSMSLLDAEPKPKLFMDYAPRAFREVREAFGLSEATYLASFRSTAKERVSAGSSGAFMFFTGDNALIVKSMRAKECRALVRMAPAYAAYIAAHPASRLIRVFGCHRLRLYGRSFYFVVMANVLHSARHCPAVSEKYDVKGSWVDRRGWRPQQGESAECADCQAAFTVGERPPSARHAHVADTVLKDLDFARELRLPAPARRRLAEQLAADSAFLKSMGIMDYSLLVGVHACRFAADAARGQAPGARRQADEAGWHLAPLVGEPSVPGGPAEVYFVGVIDILQEWDWEKKLERAGKVLIGKSARGISAVAPGWYCRRFQARVAQLLLGGPAPEELLAAAGEDEEDEADAHGLQGGAGDGDGDGGMAASDRESIV